MTDELAGGAAAPAEAVSTPDVPSNTPEPITESTPRGAIDRAFDAIEKSDPAPVADKVAPKAPDAVPAVEGERERNPDGTFKPKDPAAAAQPAKEAAPADPAAVGPTKEQAPAGEAPTRFSPDAKVEWAKTPEPVKAEVTRAIRELEQGIEKYRGDAAVYNETFKPFVDLAKSSGVEPKATLSQYVGIDMLLNKDFDAGIRQIFQNKGAKLEDWITRQTGQPAAPQDQTIAELRQEIAQLRQGFDGVSQTIQQQQNQGINQSLEGFTATLPDADKVLFNELDAEIAAYLRDPSTTLADAFAKAKADDEARYTRRYGPRASSAPVPAVPTPPAPAPRPQTLPGSLSINGAPSSGSDPASRKTPSSPRAALDDAFASLGIG
jgi:uncharacterized protein YukE